MRDRSRHENWIILQSLSRPSRLIINYQFSPTISLLSPGLTFFLGFCSSYYKLYPHLIINYMLIPILLTISLLHPILTQQEMLLNRIFCGYQAWFTAQPDGSGNQWTHYKMHSSKPFAKDNCVIDFWPDMQEYQKKYPTPQLGSTASLFSPYDYSTVLTHFNWMKRYSIDGIFLQRFGSDIRDPGSNIYKFKNVVFENVIKASLQTQRLWALMYDLSGLQTGQIKSVIMRDWEDLNKIKQFTLDSSYIKHKGKPLVSIWGIGFNDHRKYSLEQCRQLVQFIKNAGCTVMVGVPTFWRQGGKDAVTGQELQKLHQIILMADVVSPWSVGRYSTPQAAQEYARDTLKLDLEWCRSNKVELLPVIFPGFSWHNLQVSGENPDHPGPYNQIPRLQNGKYMLQVQGNSDISIGAKMLYVAMFDQMNEGTAIFKCSNNPPSLQDGLKFVPYQQEPDFYLKLVGAIGNRLKSRMQSE